jgi:hypothetical protein
MQGLLPSGMKIPAQVSAVRALRLVCCRCSITAFSGVGLGICFGFWISLVDPQAQPFFNAATGGGPMFFNRIRRTDKKQNLKIPSLGVGFQKAGNETGFSKQKKYFGFLRPNKSLPSAHHTRLL